VTRLAVPLLAAAILLAPVPMTAVRAQTPGENAGRSELRVCADPNDLPFSNEKGEGYENKTAELVGRELNLPVRFVYFPQVIGFVRNTLRARSCDLIMGTVAGDDVVQTTSPYYYSDYVVVWPEGKAFAFTDFDDPRLKTMRIGIISATPPSDLLIRHELMANAKPYALMVVTRYESPAREMVEDLVKGEIDVALLWGPIAGYYIKRDALKRHGTLNPHPDVVTDPLFQTGDFFDPDDLDAATLLPIAITFNVHPDVDANINIPVEVDFSNYQLLNGLAVPLHVQQYLQGGLFLDAVFTNVVVNSGLPDSDFVIQ